jgi:hypothetical protein
VAAVGLLLAVILVGLGVGTVRRQVRTRRRLREERFLPSDDRAYLRGLVWRGRVVGGVLIAAGGMIGGYYLSGMDARMDAIGDRRKAAAAAGEPEPGPADPADKAFTRFAGLYVIGILGLVFTIACLAVVDFWATRRYWMAQYRLLRADHQAKLERDLAVYRQARENDRMTRLRGRPPGQRNPDDTDENPPAG